MAGASTIEPATRSTTRAVAMPSLKLPTIPTVNNVMADRNAR